MRMCPVLLLAGLSLAPAAALAQKDADAKKVTFVEFDPILIEAGKARPLGELITARTPPKFANLLRLKRDVLPSLKSSAHDVSLR